VTRPAGENREGAKAAKAAKIGAIESRLLGGLGGLGAFAVHSRYPLAPLARALLCRALVSLSRASSALLAVALTLCAACDGDAVPHTDAGADAGVDAGADATTDAGGDAAVCARPFELSPSTERTATGLRINEVLSANDGVNVDELGETDDWIELINDSDAPIALAGYALNDGDGKAAALPDRKLAPGETLLLWADGAPEQGPLHLPFKLDADGEPAVLWAAPCVAADVIELPALSVNQSYARLPDASGEPQLCRYATPGRTNGERCTPPAPPELPDDTQFAPYAWPLPWPEAPGPLLISELALRPARFVELTNVGSDAIDLSAHALRLAPHAPGQDFPDASAGVELALPGQALAPGARIVLPVSEDDTRELAADPTFEGVLTLFRRADQGVADRVDFMRWPEGASLAREPADAAQLRFCSEPTPGAAGCSALAQRATGDRVRHLRSAADFAALAAGGTELGQSAVKFVIDMQPGGDVVHLLGSAWALHYTFVRERIYGEPPLDRCDPAQAAAFNQGWYEFSTREYFRVEGRRFLLGTLVEHASGLHTVEFATGDTISSAQMKRAFFSVMAHVPDPQRWALRPQSGAQAATMRQVDGELPIVGLNAPFADLRYQPLTQAVGYGVLQFVPAAELEEAELGAQVIVVTDDVPNDVPLTGGLVTEAFQTPLAHVNVLSQARGTPNMALRDARADARLAPLFGKLVRLEVQSSDFSVREADAEEAAAFYAARMPSGPRLVPAFDESVRGVQPLLRRTLADSISVGAKAAQFAELYSVAAPAAGCPIESVPLNVPEHAFALPFVHYSEHLQQSGAAQRLSELFAQPAFHADPRVRAAGLAEVRELIARAPLDPALLAELEQAVRARFGTGMVRVRSSSNTEDLPSFNGAGLHTSLSAELDDPERPLADAVRGVWASLWNLRAYDERELGHLEQSASRMGLLVHGGFDGEGAQGVGISRNLLDVTRSDIYYINAQIGEATVTNPAPGVATEQVLYTWPPRTPALTYQSLSSLTAGEHVLSADEVRAVACALGAVHAHFRPLLDPGRLNRLFAMQIEFKLTRERRLYVKQARPQPFGSAELPADCRDI
jgi:Pyruvate phosphate dikinase, AMP/ATP-binding domain/Lamin Tail Domain